MILKDIRTNISLGRITELNFKQNFSHLELNFECLVDNEEYFKEFFSITQNINFIIDYEDGTCREINGRLSSFDITYDYVDRMSMRGFVNRIPTGIVTSNITIFVYNQNQRNLIPDQSRFLRFQDELLDSELEDELIEEETWVPQGPKGIITFLEKKVKNNEPIKQELIILKRKLTLRKNLK